MVRPHWSRQRLLAQLVLLLVLLVALAAPVAGASPNRPCGVIKVRGEFIDVATFGAGGPRCSEARRVMRRTYKRKRRYRGYRCQPREFPVLWTCHRKRDSANVVGSYWDV